MSWGPSKQRRISDALICEIFKEDYWGLKRATCLVCRKTQTSVAKINLTKKCGPREFTKAQSVLTIQKYVLVKSNEKYSTSDHKLCNIWRFFAFFLFVDSEAAALSLLSENIWLLRHNFRDITTWRNKLILPLQTVTVFDPTPLLGFDCIGIDCNNCKRRPISTNILCEQTGWIAIWKSQKFAFFLELESSSVVFVIRLIPNAIKRK